MKRYLRLYKIFFRNSLSAFAAYRANFFLYLLIDTGWVTVNIVIIETLFTHTDEIVGWDRGEVYILFAFFQITLRIFNLITRNNLIELPDLITDGSLDIYLTKPVSMIFMISFKYIHLKAIVNIIFPIIIFIYGFSLIDANVAVVSLLGSVWLTMIGLMSMYATLLAAETLSFWFYRFSNVYELYSHAYRIARFPIDIYGKLKIIFLTIIPIGLASYLSARALLSKLDWWWIIYATALSFMFLFSAIKFWNFALKRYSSASS